MKSFLRLIQIFQKKGYLEKMFWHLLMPCILNTGCLLEVLPIFLQMYLIFQ